MRGIRSTEAPRGCTGRVSIARGNLKEAAQNHGLASSFTLKAKSPVVRARKKESILCAGTAVLSGSYLMAMAEFVSLVHVIENGHRGS
jgi:hypothetical protein